MLASGDDGVVEVGVNVPQMPIALIGEDARRELRCKSEASFQGTFATPTLNFRQAQRVSSSKAS